MFGLILQIVNQIIPLPRYLDSIAALLFKEGAPLSTISLTLRCIFDPAVRQALAWRTLPLYAQGRGHDTQTVFAPLFLSVHAE